MNIRLKGKKLHMDREKAFLLMDCKKDNPMYEEMLILYEEIWQEMSPVIEPQGMMGFSENRSYAVVLYTLGAKVDHYISSLFSEGQYLKATFANAMADACLFSMEEEWRGELCTMCQRQNRGIEKRLEAPGDFPVQMHRDILEHLKGEEIGVSLTSGFMFSPVKTCCFLFLLTEDVEMNHSKHDCKKCGNTGCRLKSDTLDRCS